MKTIYRENTARLSVADAKRLILDAVPAEKAVDVYAQVDDQGNINWDGDIECRVNEKANIPAAHLDNDFLATCNALSIQPRMKYRPVFTDYTGNVLQDEIYTIAHSEFVRLAELFGLLVVTGEAPEPQPITPSPAPVVTVSASGGEVTAPNWRMQIQAEAYERWLRLRASGCNPSVHSICEDLAKWCIEKDIKGGKGQNPRAGTIRNTVLGARHWTPPHHSIEQAKKHFEQIARTAQT